MAFCTNCGEKLSEGVKFCGNCGKAVSFAEAPAVPQEPEKESGTALGARAAAACAPPRKNPKKTVLAAGIAAVLVTAAIAFAVIGKPFRGNSVKVFSVDLDGQVKVGTPITFSGGNSLPEELQWLAVRTACIGVYNNAQAGNYTLGDPQDNYKPEDIRQFLTGRTGDQTKTDMFYGICFNYAEAAYNDLTQYADQFGKLGVQEWYIAAVHDKGGEIILYDTAPQKQASLKMNGVYVKEMSRHEVRSHGNATRHAWLWVYGTDGEVYWIDPTWTDNTGYPWWGVVRDGEELQLNPLESLCAAKINPRDESFAYINRGNAGRNKEDYSQAAQDYEAALRIDPRSAAAWKGRGEANFNQKEYDRAIEDFTQAIKLAPKDAEAYMDRSVVYTVKFDFDRAIADANQAIKLDPNDAYAYIARGAAYVIRSIAPFYKGYTDIHEASAAVKANSFGLILPLLSKDSNELKGMYSGMKADFDRAQADLDTASRIAPDIPQLQEARGQLEAYRALVALFESLL